MAGGDAWIGGSDGDVEGSWVWMDSEDGFNIRKWSPGKKPELYYTFHVVSNRLFIPFHYGEMYREKLYCRSFK